MVYAGDVIKLVYQFPCLYDPESIDYKNPAKREEAWTTIGMQLNQPGKKFLILKYPLILEKIVLMV